MTRPAACPPAGIDRIDEALASLIVVLVVVGGGGLLLADLGVFNRQALSLVAAAGLVLAALTWRAMSRAAAPRLPTSRVAGGTLAAVIAIGTWSVREPMTPLVDGADGSMYLALGRIVASSGTLRPTEASLDAVPEASRALIFGADRYPPYRLELFPGGIQIAPDGGIELNFFHLTPIALAAAELWFGTGAPVWVNPILAILGGVLVWAASRRLSGSPWAGLAASALLWASFAQSFFARFPTSETLAAVLTVAGLWLLLVAVDTGVLVVAVAAGVTIGLSGAVRLDTLVMVTMPIAVLTLSRAVFDPTRRRVLGTAAVAAVAVMAAVLVHAFVVTPAYTQRVFHLVFVRSWQSAGHPWWTLAAAATIGVVWILRGAAWLGPGLARVTNVTAAVVVAGALGIVAMRLVANPIVDLVSPAGLALLGAGLASLALARDQLRAGPFAIVLIAAWIVYGQHPRDIDAGMPLPLRRYVPVILPVGAIGAAWALGILSRASRAGAVIVAIAVVLWAALPAWPLRAATLYQDHRAQLDRLAALLPADGVTLVDSNAPSHLALSLRAHLHRVVVQPTARGAGDAAGQVVEEALRHGRPVRFVIAPMDARTTSLARRDFGAWAVRPVGASAFAFDAIRGPRRVFAMPASPVRLDYRLEVYDVAPPRAGDGALPFTVDVGRMDFGVLSGGMHAPELMEGATGRWTTGALAAQLPAVEAPPDASVTLVVRMAAPRPPGHPAPTVTVTAADVTIGSAIITRAGFGEYAFAVPAEALARLRAGTTVVLSSPTFVPAESDGGSDTRRLGVAVDWITLRRDR